MLQRLLAAKDRLHADLQHGPTLDELADDAGVSRAHFARQFAATFGVAPHQYLLGLRLAHAKRVLATGGSVTEACFEVGFESLGTFSAMFHRRLGQTPRRWQQAARPFVQSLGVPVLSIPGCFLRFYVKHV